MKVSLSPLWLTGRKAPTNWLIYSDQQPQHPWKLSDSLFVWHLSVCFFHSPRSASVTMCVRKSQSDRPDNGWLSLFTGSAKRGPEVSGWTPALRRETLLPHYVRESWIIFTCRKYSVESSSRYRGKTEGCETGYVIVIGGLKKWHQQQPQFFFFFLHFGLGTKFALH